MMKTKTGILLGFTLLGTCLTHAQRVIEIATVLVGDAVNPDDTTGFGGVSYDYRIGTYEVTNAQYVSFLNAVASTDTYRLYSTSMGTHATGGITRSGSSGSYSYSVRNGRENNPVNFVSFWDATRFANWLTTGDTETGVYNLGGVTSPSNAAITRDADAWAAGGVAIASEDEWYKAAYYSGSPTGADGDGYWLYPTQSNSITLDDANSDLGRPIAVGSYARPSHYGTFDQGGNTQEWNDAIVGGNRVWRGGSFSSFNVNLRSSIRFVLSPTNEGSSGGFRVSSLEEIPEPSHGGLLVGVLALWMAVRSKGRTL